MQEWRNRLFIGAVSVFLVSYGLGIYFFPAARNALYILLGAYVAGSLVLLQRQKTIRMLSANLALGVIFLLIAGGCIVGLSGLKERFPLDSRWQFVLAVLLGLGCVYISWRKAKIKEESPSIKGDFTLEKAPAKQIIQNLNWEALDDMLSSQPQRLLHLRSLRRLHILIEENCSYEELRNVILQEGVRIEQEARAQKKQAMENDALTQAARLVEWGIQKLPEIAELDMSDVLMAKSIADIRTLHSEIEHIMVSHHQLKAIHPIDRDTANDKCNARAAAARKALPILQAHDMKLTENLIAAEKALAEFESVTGFQVVKIDEGYVTFEGNGRREALRRAFPDQEVFVEVRLFKFSNPATQDDIERRVKRVRRWKKVQD